MAVLTIASILVAGALPAMSSVGALMKLSSFSNVFLSQLHLARSEAIKRNSRVVICKSADGAACSETGGWEQGSIVFHDANDNGFREAGELLIQRGEPLPSEYRLAGNQNVRHYISFNPRGMTRQAGTLTLCSRSIEPVAAREVVISMVGRPRIQKTSVAFCA
jgi:type IV fimbrial biogenesis protein FimT